jgi:MEMO1 family protein
MNRSPDQSWLVFSGIAPHPPIMVPEVGGDAISEVTSSLSGMQEFSQRVIESGAETVVLISPHAPLKADAFVAYEGPRLSVGFATFGAPQVNIELEIDQTLLELIREEGTSAGYKVELLSDTEADHGSAVPFYFLSTHGWRGKVVVLGYCFLSNSAHLSFGKAIRSAIERYGKQVAFVASGDLSHRLKPRAPAGYNPDAHFFDEAVVQALTNNEPNQIAEIDQGLRKLAGECGYRSMLTAIGVSRETASECEVLSYQAPFGVGYLVAQLSNVKSTKSSVEHSAIAGDVRTARLMTSIAREAVESFVRGDKPRPPSSPSGLLAERAPCFVSLKTIDGDLRGCIGTIEPSKDNLAEEIFANAISAASQDPRFLRVDPSELGGLRYSVDVLMTPEPCGFEDLDPSRYGVIVEDANGEQRGLLLPDIPGVETAAQQVEIAARKAGIAKGAALRISRFRVQRFREPLVTA